MRLLNMRRSDSSDIEPTVNACEIKIKSLKWMHQSKLRDMLMFLFTTKKRKEINANIDFRDLVVEF